MSATRKHSPTKNAVGLYLWDVSIVYMSQRVGMRSSLRITTSRESIEDASQKVGEFLKNNRKNYPYAKVKEVRLLGTIDA